MEKDHSVPLLWGAQAVLREGLVAAGPQSQHILVQYPPLGLMAPALRVPVEHLTDKGPVVLSVQLLLPKVQVDLSVLLLLLKAP